MKKRFFILLIFLFSSPVLSEEVDNKSIGGEELKQKNFTPIPVSVGPSEVFGILWDNLFKIFENCFDFYRTEVTKKFLDDKISDQLNRMEKEGRSLNDDIKFYLKQDVHSHYLNSYADEYAILLQNIWNYPKNEEEYKDELKRLETLEAELTSLHRSLKKNMERKEKKELDGECGEANVRNLKLSLNADKKFEDLYKSRVQNDCQIEILNELYPSFKDQEEIIQAALKVQFSYAKDVFLKLIKSHLGWKYQVYDSAIYVNSERKKRVFLSLADSAYLRDWPTEAYLAATHVEHNYQEVRFKKILENTGVLNWKSVVFQAAIHTPKNPNKNGADIFLKLIEKAKWVDWPVSAYLSASKIQGHSSYEAFEYLVDHGHFKVKSVSHNFQKIWESYLLETVGVLRDNIPGFLNLPSDILEGLKTGSKNFKFTTMQAGVKGMKVVPAEGKKSKTNEGESAARPNLFEHAPIAINLVNAFVFAKWTLGVVTPYVSSGVKAAAGNVFPVGVRFYNFFMVAAALIYTESAFVFNYMPSSEELPQEFLGPMAASVSSAIFVGIVIGLADSLSSYFGGSTSADTAFTVSTKIGRDSLPLFKELVDRAQYFDWPTPVYNAVAKVDSRNSARRIKFLLDNTQFFTNRLNNTYNSQAFEVSVSKNMEKLDRLKRVKLYENEDIEISFAEEALRKLIKFYPKRWRDWPASAYASVALVDNQWKREAFDELILLSLNYFFSETGFWSPTVLNAFASIENRFAKHAFLALVESNLHDESGFDEVKNVNSELKLQQFFMQRNINSKRVISCHNNYKEAINTFIKERLIHFSKSLEERVSSKITNATKEIKNEYACYLFQNFLLRIANDKVSTFDGISFEALARIENPIAADFLVSVFLDKNIPFNALISPTSLERMNKFTKDSLSLDLLKKILDRSANGTMMHVTTFFFDALKVENPHAKVVFEKLLDEADFSRINVNLTLKLINQIQTKEEAESFLKQNGLSSIDPLP